MIHGVVNMRDMGGIVALDGRSIRSGTVYRSGHLGVMRADAAALDPSVGHPGPEEHRTASLDHEAFRATGIRWVFDLRTEDEVLRSPDQVPAGVIVTHLDVLAGADESIATQLEAIYADPANADKVLADGLIGRHYEDTYRKLIRLDSARQAYAELFRHLLEVDEPLLFHCTAGKDRTGWAAASLLTLLGVDRGTVVEDYLRSNAPVLEAFQPLLDHFAEIGGDPAVVEPAFMVQPSYLHAAFDAVSEDHGSVEGYFTEALGLGPDAQEALRVRLLEVSPSPG